MKELSIAGYELSRKIVAWLIIVLISTLFAALPDLAKRLSQHPLIDVGIAYSIWYSLDTILR